MYRAIYDDVLRYSKDDFSGTRRLIKWNPVAVVQVHLDYVQITQPIATE